MSSFFTRLKEGLNKTNRAISEVFTRKTIDSALYDELESALLMSDAGLAATDYLLTDLKARVKAAKASAPHEVRALLIAAMSDLLRPLEAPLALDSQPTVMMVVGVNGAGKTTTIGKLAWHFANTGQSVILAAADTFRAAAREQLSVWSDRNQTDQTNQTDQNTMRGSVQLVSQQGADPSAVCFDAVSAGIARKVDVVIADTAGRLPTQANLMLELQKIKRVIQKAGINTTRPPPHQIVVVLDGNTGQNALAQAKAFDACLGLTGIVITKLDGTAKGGILAAIALWVRELDALVVSAQRVTTPKVYFVGVGERLEDLQAFNADQFSQALLS